VEQVAARVKQIGPEPTALEMLCVRLRDNVASVREAFAVLRKRAEDCFDEAPTGVFKPPTDK
jgi:hypothetical protein